MRGCDWRRILVRSETVSSASASSARMRSRVPSPAARSTAWRESKSRGAGRMMGQFPTLSHKHIRISLCHERGRRKEAESLIGERSEIGRWAGAIENRDAAPAAAEFRNQINEIIRACRDIPGLIRLNGDHRASRLWPDDRAGVLTPVPAAAERMRRVAVDDLAGLGRLGLTARFGVRHIDE